MKRKINLLFVSLVALFIVPNAIKADVVEKTVCTATCDYTDLKTAFEEAEDNTKITLKETVSITDTLKVDEGKNIILNLGSFDINATHRAIEVENGTLTIEGTGTIKDSNPEDEYALIKVIGSDSDVANYSNVTIGEGVTLEGYSGVVVYSKSATSSAHKPTYGVNVTLNGKIVVTRGTDGIGISINGNISKGLNDTFIILGENSSIEAENGTGVYIAGYGHLITSKGSNITADTGIVAKSGYLSLNGNVTAKGEYEDNIEASTSGPVKSGAAIQIESNPAYSGEIELVISDGTYKSENGSVIQEFNASEGEETSVKSVSVLKGEFVAADDKDVFDVTEEFTESQGKFIKGGKFSKTVENYIAEGYTTDEEGNVKAIEEPTPEVEVPNTYDGISLYLIISVISLIGMLSVGYIFKKKSLR